MKRFLLLLVFSISIFSYAQKYKFGKVSKEELEEKVCSDDASANAAFLYTDRNTIFVFDKERGGFVIEDEYYVRLKIYNQNGYDWATKNIKTYHYNSAKEEIFGLKAVTYNLVNGKIEETKLKKSSVFEEALNKHWDKTSFTLPNLKEGSIVEWKYTIRSPFFSNFNEVVLQEEIPIKKLHVRIAMPEYYNYNTKFKGFFNVPLKTNLKQRTVTFTVNNRSTAGNITTSKLDTGELTFNESIHSIDMVNVPALKDEPYAGNINNYKAGIKYELSYIKYPTSPLETYTTDWEAVVEKIFFSSSFGDQIKKTNHFEDDLKNALIDVSVLDKKIETVYEFVKQKIKWNGNHDYFTDMGVKKAYKEGVGNTADINLNLVAMLQHEGVDAHPVLVSTISRGIPLFPTRSGFNYVIAGIKTDKGYILLDATDKYATPNILPKKTLNFRGRIINKYGKSEWVDLYPSKHAIENVVISAKFDGEAISGISKKTLNNHYAYDYRHKVGSKNKENLIEWISENLPKVEVINARTANTDNPYKDIVETIQFETDNYFEVIGDKTYINPLLYFQITENPFVSDKREFPIYYNYPWADQVQIKFSIPEGYSIESLPEPAEISLPNNMGSFKYAVSSLGNAIEVKATTISNEPVIPATYYSQLQEFFKQIIAKESERIILSKN